MCKCFTHRILKLALCGRHHLCLTDKKSKSHNDFQSLILISDGPVCVCVCVCVCRFMPWAIRLNLCVHPSLKWFLTRRIILDESDSGVLQWSLETPISQISCSVIIVLQYQTVSFSYFREKYKQA